MFPGAKETVTAPTWPRMTWRPRQGRGRARRRGLDGLRRGTGTDGRAEHSRPARAGWLAGRGARERTHRGRGRLAASA